MTTGAPSAPVRLLRFDRVQRMAHWVNAALFGVLIVTALPLYFGAIERRVGRHLLFEEIHVWSGVALPVPVIVSLVGPWGARMRRDVRRFNRWSRQELRWLWTLGGSRELEKDKFNPGQKLNAVFIGAAIVVMLGTGLIMKWFGLFPVSWRTGATFVHEVLAFLIVLVVLGHIFMALTHRDSLRSMIRGWVSITWAERHAPCWAREEIGTGSAAKTPDDRADVATTGRAGVKVPPAG